MSRSTHSNGDRVVIYMRGAPEEIAHQREECRAQAESEGAVVAGLAADGPDTVEGWMSAQAMVKRGDADRVLMSSRTLIPLVESVTGEIPRDNIRRPPSPGRRRPNLLC